MSIEDRLAILETMANLNYTSDANENEAWSRLFTEDGVFEVLVEGSEPQLILGRPAIFDLITSVRATFPPGMQTRHFQTSIVFLELGPELAKTRSMVLETKTLPGDPGPTNMVTGFYEDRWRKTPDGWRLAHRTLHSDRR
jgi:hypothetical protein